MTSRLEWSRYEGNDIEAVVAMMINREHPNSVRITPSQGDGGVDILDRGAGPEGGDVVYQVKRYHKTLTKSQKTKISKSLERLFETGETAMWKGLNVTQWRLVMPLDPTKPAYKWFEEATAPYQVNAVWNGLTFVEQLTAKYPDVVDFYLHGGRSAMEAAYQKAMALMSIETGPLGESVPAVMAKVRETLKVLDHDPHYTYNLRTGSGAPLPVQEFPGLVMTQFVVDKAEDTWHAVDVVARCAESTNERPILIHGTISAKKGSDFASQLEDFANFGAPFSSPEGAFTGAIEAPGGLGAKIDGSAVNVWSRFEKDNVDDEPLLLDIISPIGAVLAEVNVRRRDRTSGRAGLRVVLEEENGLFSIEMRYTQETSAGSWNIKFNEAANIPVMEAIAPTEFIAALQPPNSFRVRPRYAGAQAALPQPIDSIDDDGQHSKAATETLRALKILATIQKSADKTILVPKVDFFGKQVRKWHFVAEILSGKEITGTVPEDHAIYVTLDDGMVAPTGSFSVAVPLNVYVGDQLVRCGQMRIDIPDPVFLEPITDPNGKEVLQIQVPGGKVRHSLVEPS